MCRKKPKPRQFFLFNDILVYGNIVMNKKKVLNYVLKEKWFYFVYNLYNYNKQFYIMCVNSITSNT